MKHALTILALTLAAPALADPSVERGAEIAGEFCARCHDVGAGGAMKQHPPSFAAIARFRAPEQIEARIWYPGLHTGMPDYSMFLERDAVLSLTAYIQSLE